MELFVSNLEKELNKKLKKIESSDLNILKKSLEASLVLGDAFQRLKEFIIAYTFRNDAEEIEFFKVIKPRLYHRLIYYRKIHNIEMNRPVGVNSQTAYLIDEIKAINRYNNKHSDFVRYYRSGMTHLVRFITCEAVSTRHFIWNHSIMSATRNSRPMQISRWRNYWPTKYCSLI